MAALSLHRFEGPVGQAHHTACLCQPDKSIRLPLIVTLERFVQIAAQLPLLPPRGHDECTVERENTAHSPG